jgi:hypothetical protein
MQRDILLLTEMIDAVEQTHQLADGHHRHPTRSRPAAPGRLAMELHGARRSRRPGLRRSQGPGSRHRLAVAAVAPQPDVHGYWSIDLAVLHTTGTTQLPGFAVSLRQVLSALDDGT